MTLLRMLRSDLRRFAATGGVGTLRAILFAQGFWAAALFRMSNRVSFGCKPPILQKIIRFCCHLLRKVMEVLTGISLSPECDIGEGLYIGHFGNIIIAPSVKMGNNCNLSQGVTIGHSGRKGQKGCPRLGDRVFVGANAVVIGPIEIGDDVAIGAGAVVTKTTPARAVVVGNPARVVSFAGSFDLIRYDGMEQDESRKISIAQASVHRLDHADTVRGESI